MNSKQRYDALRQEQQEGTRDAMTDFVEDGFQLFPSSPETAKVHMEQAARNLARFQSKEAIQAMINALQKVIM